MTCLIKEMTHDYFVQQYYGCAAIIDGAAYKFIGFIYDTQDPRTADQNYPRNTVTISFKQSVLHVQRGTDPDGHGLGQGFWKVLANTRKIEDYLELVKATVKEEESIHAKMKEVYAEWNVSTDNTLRTKLAKDYSEMGEIRTIFVRRRDILEKLEKAAAAYFTAPATTPEGTDDKVVLVFQSVDDEVKFVRKDYDTFKELEYFDIPRGYFMISGQFHDTLIKARAIQQQRFIARNKEFSELQFIKAACFPEYETLETAVAKMRASGARRWALSPNMYVDREGAEYLITHRVLGQVGVVSLKEVKLPRKMQGLVNMALLEEALNG